MKNIELLAPAGNYDKLKTAIYYGADAVYVGGKEFSLRALSDNFTHEELASATEYVHALNKKIYVTVNIFAKNDDIDLASDYFKFLESIKVDAVLITDPGLIVLCKSVAPNLVIHLSTQANTLNKLTVKFWADQGIERVVLARELSLKEITEISESMPEGFELEAFSHGAMCISYSGRCLLSNYFSNRDSNRGACVQACRWNYEIRETTKDGDFFPIEEDKNGTYLLNSKDLNMIDHLDALVDAGIMSFKIEGRMKSQYYLATVINSYRRAIDKYLEIGADYKKDRLFANELLKTAHRVFTTAYMLGDNDETVNYEDCQSIGERKFIAIVVDTFEGGIIVEMRNRFKVGDELEILSPSEHFNKILKIEHMEDEKGEILEDAKNVQQRIKIFTNINLTPGDILRK